MNQVVMIKIAIPENLDFSDLKLGRESDGSVSFDWSVIEKICEESNIPIAYFREGSEDRVSELMFYWYMEHLKRGGKQDPVADDLIREVEEEVRRGQNYSHEPGRA